MPVVTHCLVLKQAGGTGTRLEAGHRFEVSRLFTRHTLETGQQQRIYIVVQPQGAVQEVGDGYIRANANAMRAIERVAMRSGTERE